MKTKTDAREKSFRDGVPQFRQMVTENWSLTEKNLSNFFLQSECPLPEKTISANADHQNQVNFTIIK